MINEKKLIEKLKKEISETYHEDCILALERAIEIVKEQPEVEDGIMNNTSFNCSLNDTTELRKLIMDNPTLPLLFFCGEECYRGEYPYEQAFVTSVSIQDLTLYNNYWLDEDDYAEELSDDLCDEPEYKHLSDKEYFEMIDRKVKETEFIKAIIVNIG